MFQNMEYVYEVYKEKSFSKAAKNLYVTQPCLSAMVKKVEKKLGIPIFNRNVKPIQLTEYGLEYIRYVEQIMTLQNNFETYLNDVRDLKSGKIAIGSNNLCTSFVLPRIIKSFTDKYPEIKIELHEGNIFYLEDQIKKGTLDLILDNYPIDENIYEKKVFHTENLLLAVPNKLKLDSELSKCGLSKEDIINDVHLDKSSPTVSMKCFENYPFVALYPGNDTRNRFDMLCKEADFSPKIILEVEQLVTSYNIVCSNMGIALVSDTLIKNMPIYGDLKYYKLNSKLTIRELFFHYPNTRYTSFAVKRFIEEASYT